MDSMEKFCPVVPIKGLNFFKFVRVAFGPVQGSPKVVLLSTPLQGLCRE